MAITYITSIERPDDGQTFGGNAACSLLINAVGASTGDLVKVIAQYRGATTIEVNESGGQTWNTLTALIDAANLTRVQYFWCRWDSAAYNGTNPSFFANGTSGNPFTCVAHIFRPSDSAKLWGVDIALASTQFSAPGSPFTVTRTGVTTTQASSVTIASWHTSDANTWNSLSGTGWSTPGTAQYRNLTGSAQSSTYAYKIQTSAGATGNVSKNQATNGGDAGVTGIITFYEYNATSPISGTTSGSSIATSNIVGVGVIAGSASGQATASATIIGLGIMSGTSTGQASATSNATAIGYLSGQSAGVANATSNISAIGYITGISAGSSTAVITHAVSGNAINIEFKSTIKKSINGSSLINNVIAKSTIKNFVIHE